MKESTTIFGTKYYISIMSILTIATMNCQGQTKLTLPKQLYSKFLNIQEDRHIAMSRDKNRR